LALARTRVPKFMPVHAHAAVSALWNAPEHRALERARPCPASLPPRRLATPLTLRPRHAQAPSRALSPSSSSSTYRGYRDDYWKKSSVSVALSLRQLAVEHRQDDAYKMLYSPCPFDRRRSRAMAVPLQHARPPPSIYKYRRSAPSLLTQSPPLSSLSIPTQSIPPELAGAARIASSSPPEPAEALRGLEPPRAPPLRQAVPRRPPLPRASCQRPATAW
jgi:hypothetical protein